MKVAHMRQSTELRQRGAIGLYKIASGSYTRRRKKPPSDLRAGDIKSLGPQGAVKILSTS